MQNQLNMQQLIKQELERCKNDPIYFIRKYVKIQHPIKRVIPFDLYPIQEKLIQFYSQHRYVITEKPRQMGVTWCAVAFALHQMIFNSNYKVLIAANKEATAKNVLERIKFAYEQLPKFLQIKKRTWNKTYIEFANYSSARAVSSKSDSGRSESITLLIVEEAAFIPNMDELWASVQQTLATGGRCIVNSTYNGVGNWYERVIREAKEGKSEFKYFGIKWSDHPERDQKWFEEQKKLLSPRVFAQEVLCIPQGSGENVLPLHLIRTQEFVDPLVVKYGGDYWEWERKSGGFYFISVDPAGGKGDERSAIGVQVLWVDPRSITIEQVAEFASDKTPLPAMRHVLRELFYEFKPAGIFIETNGIGLGLYQFMEAYTPNIIGYYTTQKKKVHGSDLLAKLYEDGKLILRSRRLLSQLERTTWVKNKVETVGRSDLYMALINGLMAIVSHEIMEGEYNWEEVTEAFNRYFNNTEKTTLSAAIVEEFGEEFRFVAVPKLKQPRNIKKNQNDTFVWNI